YRDDQPCGDGNSATCTERLDPERTLLGPQQRARARPHGPLRQSGRGSATRSPLPRAVQLRHLGGSCVPAPTGRFDDLAAVRRPAAPPRTAVSAAAA
ncbi:hypothetical protein ABZ215_40310, partial [Amycolatopsis sp. NPDC006131]|uniref:hypothetical protein n=1 Tax=Amycolatopsis sp. NPDC006131 TaxID=3156731 RepID=UPI0033B19746